MPLIRINCWLLAGIFIYGASALPQSAAQGGVPAGEPQFKLVRSVSGSKGQVQNGRFVVQDPRDVFYLPTDKQVVVYFEWDGPIGAHHLEGFWKSPQGKTVVMSDFTYEAKQRRFGAYWSLDFTEGTRPGTWALEARIDGEVAGNHSFQLISGEKALSTSPSRSLLEPAEIYKRSVRAAVWIEKLDEKRERIGTGSGFFLDNGLLVTAFQVINAASALRIVLPNATRVEDVQIAAWNRLQDWALLKPAVVAPATLPRAKEGSWRVADRCFSLDVPTEGNRVIVDENITGMHDFAQFGPRLNLSQNLAGTAIGAPVLNEYGEVIGIFGGSLLPGAPSKTERTPYSLSSTLAPGSMATPVSVLPGGVPATQPQTLADLATMGEFVIPVVKQPELLQGFLTTHFDPKKNEIPGWRESKTEFSGSERHCTLVLVWNPRTKLRDEVTLFIYDLANRVVVQSNPLRIKFGAGSFAYTHWDMDFSRLALGSHRLDVLQGGKPIWRTYFRIIE